LTAEESPAFDLYGLLEIERDIRQQVNDSRTGGTRARAAQLC
jgi:hypothetical protein